MSINWVMLSPHGGFAPLEGEQRLWSSTPRAALYLESAIKYPGKQPYLLQSSAGTLYLTNRRIIYLPAAPTPQFQSFAAPLLYLHDSHVTAPWFGPNAWVAALQPVPNGGIPRHVHAMELSITFKEGGAYDYSTRFERVRERLQQVVEAARENGLGTGAGGQPNFDSVNLDELPAYSEQGSTVQSLPEQVPASIAPTPRPVEAADRRGSGSEVPSSSRATTTSPPEEPPPGYEEATTKSYR